MATAEAQLDQGVLNRRLETYAVVYVWCVSCIGLFLGVYAAGRLQGFEFAEVAPWILAALVGDALAVRLSGSIALSASLPVTLAASFVLDPAVVGLVGFLGVWQAPGRTWQALGFSLFNRVEVALAAFTGAVVVSAAGGDTVDWPLILLVAMCGLLADSAVNVGLMLPVALLRENARPIDCIKRFLGRRPVSTLAAYGSAVLAAPVLLVAWNAAGAWGLLAALVCVALAALSLRASQDLGETIVALDTTKALVREGTNRIALERRDERRSLAGELHDEVLPSMFKVHLMGEVIRRDLETGRLLELDEDVRGLVEATELAQASIRQVVGNLRESPVGARGLASAVRAMRDGMSYDGMTVVLDVNEIRGDDRGQTVAYQVVREALSNAVKYSRASEVRVAVTQDGSILRVAVSDDGCGFDVDEGLARLDHFGLSLMKERVAAVGGDFHIDSRLGGGTTVWATIPVQSRAAGDSLEPDQK